MELRRIAGPGVAMLLAVGVAAAAFVSHARKNTADAGAAVVSIKGMIGSEKQTYFADPRVVARLRALGFSVSVDKVGSRAISGRSLQDYDFGFPAGAPAAIALQAKAKARQIYTTFYTPMAVASWRPLVPILQREGLVTQLSGGSYTIDMKGLLNKIAAGTRWRDMNGNTVYATGKSVLISSTDIRTSNSAAMYLSLASYVMNGNDVVSNSDQVNRLVPGLAPLFAKQGLQESSTAGPFDDYTTMGMGKAPLVMIYESQFLEYQSKRAEPNADMVLLYPRPTLYTKHIVVPFTENGRRFGEALASDPELQSLAVEYGYRTSVPQRFTEFLKSRQLQAPETLVDVVDPPSYEMLERMTQAIEQSMQ